MATTRSKSAGPAYRCSECGASSARWVGRCGECQAWGTITEVGATSATVVAAAAAARTAVREPALPIAQVDATVAAARPTGIGELDRALGGGLVPGAVVLLAGEPGIGKSTLLLEVGESFARQGLGRALIVTGEESTAQVRMRAERVGATHRDLYLAAENDLAALLAHVDTVKPSLLVVDSVQTVATSAVEGSAGGVPQIRAVTGALIAVAKERGIATVVVGHVTKDGSVAGPRTLEHLVDVVLHFDGERHSTLRLIRATKNRFGPADEIGCFEMLESGLVSLDDPSSLFLADRTVAVPGTCATVTLEGRRPLVTEVQALTSPTNGGSPRRAVTDLDHNRVTMALAVLSRALPNAKLHEADVFVASVGGLRITEPAADLAVALAVASAHAGTPLPPTMCAIGEVALSGDVRRVTGLERRLAAAARLGFRTAVIPAGAAPSSAPPGLELLAVPTVGEAAVVLQPSNVRRLDPRSRPTHAPHLARSG
ncbi:DNA repair protein RadA [Jatrophihabitans sp. YIM 134969]